MFKNELRRSKNTYIILEFLYKAFIFKLLRFAQLLMNLQKERLNIFFKSKHARKNYMYNSFPPEDARAIERNLGIFKNKCL